MPDLARTITDDHALSIFAPRGINPRTAQKFGVYSVTSPDELPEEFAGGRYVTIPGLVFTWQSPTGGAVLQYRPDEPIANDGGDPVKYVFPGGTQMVLNKLIDPAPHDGPILLAEGTMQSIAAAQYAPRAWAVYGMSGCWSWRRGETQVAIPDLMVAEDREVVVALDADAATNRNVFDAGMALKAALLAEGAQSVKFVRLGGHGAKAGLDDVLGSRPEEKRATYLARMIENASDKPADARPAARRSTDKERLTANLAARAEAGRPMLVVNEDRHEVINRMTEILTQKWDGTDLFSYGGVLARRRDANMEPVTDGIFADLISEAAVCVATTTKGDAIFQWPDEQSRKAVLSSRSHLFSPLDRISRVPFVRPDGTICQTSGYDAATNTYLVLDESAERVVVPEQPSEEDVRSAVKLLTEEWLGDLFDIMPEQADRANALGLVLTPLIRGLVPLAPMAVVDGLQMGVGKNLVADCLAIFATGTTADPLPYSREDEENRKVVLATYATGSELFVFDEAHVIQGPALAKALTAITHKDRVLGVSRMASYPNRVTWIALGNNVSVNGDLSRRVYRIRLAPKVANPQDRAADEFRHPDLKAWTAENRPELIAAALTLVRAWFDAGQPQNAAGRRFGSFEQWGGMVGGILDNAGVPGFLDNLVEWRSETDYEASYWTDHFSWLAEKFGSEEFTVSEVVAMMRRSNHVEHPPRLENHTVTGYTRQLGQSYGRVKNRTYAGLQLVAVTRYAGHANRWQIVDRREGTESNAGQHTPSPAPVPTTDSDDSSPATPGMSATSARSGSTYSRKETSVPYVREAHVFSTAGRQHPMYPTYPAYPGVSSDEADPLRDLLPLAVAVPAPECPDCDQPEELTPSGFWYACRRCHPGTFAAR